MKSHKLRWRIKYEGDAASYVVTDGKVVDAAILYYWPDRKGAAERARQLNKAAHVKR